MYAPGLASLDQVRAVTGAVSKPVNVLAPSLKRITLEELAEAGAKRISIGGALARAALAPVLRAAMEMRDTGSFGWTSDLASGTELERLFRQ